MYLYYDKNGLLKEIISPDDAHQSSVDYDKINVFVKGYETIDKAYVIFEDSNGVKTIEAEITKGQPKEIPYNSKRDLKYFEYFTNYAFFEIVVPESVLAVGGLALMSLRLVLSDGSFKAVDIYPFQIKDNVINDSHGITLSQYNYLLKLIASKTNTNDFDDSNLDIALTTFDVVKTLKPHVIYKGLYYGETCLFILEKITENKYIVNSILTSRESFNERGIFGYQMIFESGKEAKREQSTMINVLDYSASAFGTIEKILADISNKIDKNELAVNQSWLVKTGQRSFILVIPTLVNAKNIKYTLLYDGSPRNAFVTWETEQATENDVRISEDLKTFLNTKIETNRKNISINTNNIASNLLKINKNTTDIANIKKDYIPNSEKGKANGVAILDKDGFIDSKQIPSHIDDIVDGTYVNETTFKDANGVPVMPNTSTIYYDTKTFKRYGWSGTTFVSLGSDITFGDVKGTAYEGDKGKANADAIAKLKTNKIDHAPIFLEHGTDLLAFDWDAYENGTYFAGSKFVNLPSEMTDHTECVIQLIKQNSSGRFALLLFNTGLYESNVGTYINYHYNDKFKGWEKLGATTSIATETTLGGIKASKTTTEDTQPVHINDNGFLFTKPSAGDVTEARVSELITENNKLVVLQTEKGKASGVATLDSSGKIPSSQLPSSIDQVIEGTLQDANHFVDSEGYTWTDGSAGIESKIFVDKTSRKTYRWSGTQFSVIASDLVLGYTHESAYFGDEGKANADNIAKLQTDVKQLQDDVDTKVSKVTQNAQLYGTSSFGEQIVLPYDYEAYGDSIVQRTNDGRVKTTEPTENDDAVNLKYFNENIASGGLPIASATQLGGIKVGVDFDITTDGTLSLYHPISINSFSTGLGTQVRGTNITSVTLTWSISKVPTLLQLDGQDITPLTTTSKTISNLNITWDNTQSWILKVGDGKKEATTSTSIYFSNYVMYGTNATYDVSKLTKVLSNSRARTFNVNALEGQHIYYAIPSRLGTPTFFVGGFEGGFLKLNTEQWTNEKGYTESYDIYQSTNVSLGETKVEVM